MREKYLIHMFFLLAMTFYGSPNSKLPERNI